MESYNLCWDNEPISRIGGHFNFLFCVFHSAKIYGMLIPQFGTPVQMDIKLIHITTSNDSTLVSSLIILIFYLNIPIILS